MKRSDIHFSCAVYILPVMILCGSCIINTITESKAAEKAYHTKALWNREILGYYISSLVLGKYCYISADNRGRYITKLDLETGKVLWESDPALRKNEISYGSEYPQKIGNYLYLPVNSGIVFVFNNSDGGLAATVRLGTTETEAESYAMKYRAVPVVSGSYLFWGNGPAASSGVTRGLVRLDTAEIDFSIDPYAVQAVIPKLVWFNSWEAGIDTNILSEDEIIYFLTETYVGHDPEEVCILAAFNAETGTVIWEEKMPSYTGREDFALFINNEKLLVSEKNLSCLNKSTGELIYEVPVYDNIFDDGWDFGNVLDFQIALHNNYLYYNTGGSKLVSVNVNTGKSEWHHDASPDIVADEYGNIINRQFYSPPMVCGEKLFITHTSGLRVYNAANGKFIGVDSSIKSESELPVMYNDTLVIFNDYDYMYITAVKCE